jgi:hypothetical protein
LWGQLHVIRGGITYAGRASHFRFANLGLPIAPYFTKPGWKSFEEKLRPEWRSVLECVDVGQHQLGEFLVF